MKLFIGVLLLTAGLSATERPDMREVIGEAHRGRYVMPFKDCDPIPGTPEPATFVMLGSGIAAIVLVRRWKR